MRLFTFALATLAVACEQPPKASGAAVATVNGVAITEAELNAVLKPSAHQPDAALPERRKTALATLVRDELMRQQAVEAGLEPEGLASDEVKRLEAQLAVAKRRALADAWLRREVQRAEPTEAEARAVFEAQKGAFGTDYHVQQILLRDEALIEKAAADLRAGVPFEEVAKSIGLPHELGFLAWKQLPEPWRPVVSALSPGQASGVIKGPGNRFWLIRLVETRPRAETSFEELKPMILEDLKRGRLDQVTQRAEVELRKTARISEP
jgi:hypothetical protein